jgi:hypothetical protein
VVTLTATLTPAAATGTVTFYDGVAMLGIGPLVAGQAALTIAFRSSLVPVASKTGRMTSMIDGEVN